MDENRAILTKFAQKIVIRGFTVPAIFFLETGKYVSFLGSQMLVFFGPVITAFIRSESFYNFAELLENRKNVEFLITEIERIEKDLKVKKKKV